jgi:hypothetical protein
MTNLGKARIVHEAMPSDMSGDAHNNRRHRHHPVGGVGDGGGGGRVMKVTEERNCEDIEYNLPANIVTVGGRGWEGGRDYTGGSTNRKTTMGEDVSRATTVGSGAARTIIAIIRSTEARSRAFRPIIGRMCDTMSNTITCR